MGAAGAGPFMGGLGQLMGGSSKSSGNSTSSSDGSSQNSSVNASQSGSNQQSSNASGSANQSYGSLAKALDPSLGYVGSAGNMIGALLGLTPSAQNYDVPAPSVLPSMPNPASGHSGGSSGASNGSMIDQLFHSYLASQAAATPTPTTPVPASGGTSIPISAGSGGGAIASRIPHESYRALGGPVSAGQPYVVGENQPEVFVPHTSGSIIPSVGQAQGMKLQDLVGRHRGQMTPPIMAPGNLGGTPSVGSVPPAPAPTPAPAPIDPSSALNTWANSSGQNFILDQGQKAISGASASNGTFDSGATGKALENYGQNLGKTTLNDYMNHLFDYAKLGLGSASALSGAGGVSQSVGNSSGGSTSTSFGTSSGSSDQSSDSTSTTKSKSKQGLGI